MGTAGAPLAPTSPRPGFRTPWAGASSQVGSLPSPAPMLRLDSLVVFAAFVGVLGLSKCEPSYLARSMPLASTTAAVSEPDRNCSIAFAAFASLAFDPRAAEKTNVRPNSDGNGINSIPGTILISFDN